MRRSEATVLSKLYGVPDVHVGEAGGIVWVRGSGTGSEVESVLERVPASRFYEIVRDDRLRPLGRLLPTRRLPRLPWVPLRDWLVVRAPVAALPGEISMRAELELVFDPGAAPRGTGEEMLVCHVDAFRAFLLRAPAHRLRPLRFAVDESRGDVFVRGEPLPSLAGRRYVLEGAIATPAGTVWSPRVGTSVVRAWLGIGEDTIALWRADGSIGEVTEDAFAPASRRAGREL